MNILDEKESHQGISITPIFNICAFFHAFPTYIFCQSLGQQTNNCLYRSSNVLPAHIILMDHRPYPVLVHVQSLVLNI